MGVLGDLRAVITPFFRLTSSRVRRRLGPVIWGCQASGSYCGNNITRAKFSHNSPNPSSAGFSLPTEFIRPKDQEVTMVRNNSEYTI